MKLYGVKADYLDLWDANIDSVMTEDDVEMIVRGWGKTVDEVADQIYEMPVIFTGYDPDNHQVGIILDSGEAYVTDFLTKLYRLNEETYFTGASLNALKYSLESEGWRLQ